ncbi:YciI family protein [Edaphobacter bradus]|uniref:YciI family protein n=1 Tax=Edaphobacter bradus TaxID=2259016 RepID=UPI0021DF5911|nr:YciI family protein [Edaphobacter bradus]
MKYLLTLYAEEAGWSRMTEAQKQQGVAAYNAYSEALKKAGAYVAANRLQPIATATTVRVADGKPQVLNGPYADTKEQLGGFYLIDVPDLDGALSWAARCPGASHGTVEVRPIWEYTTS